jgi:deazaflavin-dependent oxidoreductase (nitroreductase family)
VPMPNWMRHVTKHVFNPPTIAAGKRPVLIHVGRTSGTTYQTPLDAHPVDGGYLFVLVYGGRSDWARNILAAGHARLRIDGTEVELTAPRLVGTEEADAALPDHVARPPKLLRITEFLRMDTVTA